VRSSDNLLISHEIRSLTAGEFVIANFTVLRGSGAQQHFAAAALTYSIDRNL